jgi:tyrosyl-tRNA synthetase
MPKTDAVHAFLTRGVENLYPSAAAVEKALTAGKRLRVYFGVDPTGPTLHLGHIISMRKLATLQQMGHEVILLIGDFTAMIGDPTDKAATRKRLTRQEVMANCKLYKKQASRILSFTGKNAAKFMFNSKWLAKMSFADVVELASHVTVQQMMERDMFEKRVAEGKPVHLHEFMYPLMQGQDSVAMRVDMEVGGNDQTFNMLMGRSLVKEIQGREKLVLAGSLLVDASGKKMGKTEGNMIAMTDSAEEMYGKVMSWTDGMIIPGFKLVTDVPEVEIKSMEGEINAGKNPMPYKRRLAQEVVHLLVGEREAKAADAHFTRVHQSGEAPEDIPTLKAKKGMTVAEALVASGLVTSNTDARRQVEQHGVKVDGEVVADPKATVSAGQVIQKGKRHFVKMI